MKIKVHADAILPTPLKGLHDVTMNQDSISPQVSVRETSSCYDTYVQEVLAKKGSSPQVSIAQNGIGNLTQLSPAAAMFAMSCSVYGMDELDDMSRGKGYYDERLVMILDLI